MRSLSIFVFAVIFAASVNGQVITYKDLETVIPFLEKEDFKTAFNKTSNLLASKKKDTSDLRAVIIYANIYAAAGMVTLGQMTHDVFKKNTNKYVGQKLVMFAYPCVDSSSDRAFNSLKFERKEGDFSGSVIAANNKHINILCFEYFSYKNLIDPSDFIGKTVRCGGILDSFDVNPNNSRVWISRLHIKKAFAVIETE